MRVLFISGGTRKRSRLFGILLLIMLCCISTSGYTQSPDTSEYESRQSRYSDKRVLMISSYSPSFRTFFKQINGVKSIFDLYGIKLDNEFMDTKRFYTDENFKLFENYLTYKLQHVAPYDAVITADDDATNFVMQHRQALFGETPIFFMAVNNYDNAVTYSQEDNVTGVFEAPSYHDTIKLAMALNPEATRIVGLVDDTASGQGDLTLFLAEKKNFQSLNFDVLDLSKLTFAEFQQQLSNIPRTDIVVLLSVYHDYTGTTYSFDEGLKIVLDHLNAPLYHTYEHGMGEGILGGKVVSHVIQGESAAKQVLQYFEGKPVSQIPLVDQSPNQYMIDWTVLNEYGLSQYRLPEGVTFINKPDTFMYKYGRAAVIIFFTITVEGFMIAALLRSLRSSKKARSNLQLTNEELAHTLSDVKKRDDQIHDLIYIDNLTGLCNRFAIYEQIEQQISTHPDDTFYIMFLDIDNFKNVNDLFGHDIGDALINETGHQLRKTLGPAVQVGRFGGDEFVFILTAPWDYFELIDYIQGVRKIFRESLKLSEQFFYMTISIGVAKYPEHGTTKDALIKKADIALYEAKKRGKDQYVIFDAQMDEALSEQLSFQDLLRAAFQSNEFELYYQPLFQTDNQSIMGFEALIRWHSQRLGWVSPYRLITVAEEMGLIVQLGEWIFTQAVQFAKTICQYAERPVFICVNISTLQLAYAGFYDFVMQTIQEYGVAPECICLEMTETVFMKRDTTGHNILNKLCAEGFRISLDDFGTGYSSLSYLKQFKIDILKIDKYFIENLVQDAYDRHLVELVIEVAKQKSAYVVAEGVEKKEQFELLSTMSCDIVQGYYFSKPLPADHALQLLKDTNVAMVT